MDPQHLTLMANKFQSVLDANTLNERGHQLALVEREPYGQNTRTQLRAGWQSPTTHIL